MTNDQAIKEESSFAEGVQYAGLALSVLSMLAYLAIVLTRVFTDDVSVTKVAWQGPMLLVVAIGGALYGIGYGVARLRHRGPIEDVRDKEIQRYGESINGGLVGLTAAVSIVLLASADDEQLAIQAIQEGAQDYLIKGQIESRELLRSLVNASERKIIEEIHLRG